MDYKDALIVGVATLCGLVGSIFGIPGLLVGLLCGAGIGAYWIRQSDRSEDLEQRVTDLPFRRDP